MYPRYRTNHEQSAIPNRRILPVWFPRLGADRLLRRIGGLDDSPFAVVRDSGQMQVLSSLSATAEIAGLRRDQPLRDAHAMCPGLITRLQNPQAEAEFLDVLTRWAGRFSPWVAAERPEALVLDITGCAHLIGDEAALMAQLTQEAEDMGVSSQCGIADTLGAAWALARFAGRAPGHARSGDAIDQEVRATRSRAVKRRHWERGGAAPALTNALVSTPRIAPPGQAHSVLAALPVAALRLAPEIQTKLIRLGLRRIGDLIGQPRAPLARRFGKGLVLRLDQALGAVPEPVSPAQAPPRFATGLTLPEPIGLIRDMQAALDRLIPRLCQMLRDKGRGARMVRLQAYRSDGTMQWLNVGLARAADQPDRIRPLLAMKLDEIDAGFGIDMLRLEATRTEALQLRTMSGHRQAAQAVQARLARDTALEDLIGRIGARIGLEAITRRHPASSHIPEKSASEPAPPVPRPLLLWRPEPVMAPDYPRLPARFRWRGRDHDLAQATGPERIAPEWWLDDANWQTGLRDYWQVITGRGDHLWLFTPMVRRCRRGGFRKGALPEPVTVEFS